MGNKPQDRAGQVLMVLRAAARLGVRCPTNAEIDRLVGAAVQFNDSVPQLARRGLLTVELYAQSWRVVEINGLRTMEPPGGGEPYLVIDGTGVTRNTSDGLTLRRSAAAARNYRPWSEDDPVLTRAFNAAAGVWTSADDIHMAQVLQRTPAAVAQRRLALGLRAPVGCGEDGAPMPAISADRVALHGRFFEDVTKDEARAISAGAPRSAPFSRYASNQGSAGSAAAMCAEMGETGIW